MCVVLLLLNLVRGIEIMSDLSKIVDSLSSLTILEAADLVKQLEEKWGVSASAPVVQALGGAAGSAVEEAVKDSFDVMLVDIGASKINVIKEIRAITGLGLKEAKDLVDKAPSLVKEAVSVTVADELKAKLEAVGAKVELK